MNFVNITVNFDTKEQQKAFESKCLLAIIDKETFENDDIFKSWTTFDISYCTLDDLSTYFKEFYYE